MEGFWNKKTPVITLVLFSIVVLTSAIATWGRSPQNWLPVILFIVLLLTVLNNFRINRLKSGEHPYE